MNLKARLGAWYLRRVLRKQRREGWPMFKNWKTSLLGILAAMTGGSMVGWTKPDGSINWGSVLFALATAALGHFAKDKDVTGGTIQQ